MRNQERARYARWSAMVAGLIVLVVAGVYIERVVRVLRLRRNLPAIVSAVIQQSSADFSYSDVEQGRTVFTVRASRATQFKDQSRALLQDVWITIYGRDGSRNDNIHTRECNYEPTSGAIRCIGEVQIDVQNAKPANGKGPSSPAGTSLQVKTSDLSFNRETGEAATSNPVEFQFPKCRGRGVGVTYSTRDSVIRVEHGVELNLAAPEDGDGAPVNITGSNLQIRRNDRAIVLGGPARAEQGARELAADQIVVDLDENYRAQRAIAEGHVVVYSNEQGAKLSMSADRLTGLLSPAGWVEDLSAEGNVSATRQTSEATQRLSAFRVRFAMFPGRNLPREMVASGGVSGEARQGTGSQVLKTDSIRVAFSAPGSPTQRFAPAGGPQQRIETAETLAPGTIESKSDNEFITLHASKFVASTTPDGKLDELLGHGGAQIRREVGTGVPQVSSAKELVASFDRSGGWSAIEESGDVHFQQADRQATAGHAKMVRATGQITLDGSPVLSDAVSQTSAAAVAMNQTTGEIRATGGIASTYVGGAQTSGVTLGSGPAHISADSVTGSTAGHLAYSGHARLWQGEAVLDADQIEMWRDDKKLQATGHVLAIFPQAPGSFAVPSVKSPRAKPGVSLWQVQAPVFTYWSDEGKARLAGGVKASSSDESIESRTLDIFLSPLPAEAQVSGETSAPSRPAPSPEVPSGGRQLSRALAQGAVIVRQGDRRGEAEQAEYTAADGKFVLSGGQPILINATSDTTTGHSLTFFVANDTILIDSQEGSRTLTKHRVEK